MERWKGGNVLKRCWCFQNISSSLLSVKYFLLGDAGRGGSVSVLVGSFKIGVGITIARVWVDADEFSCLTATFSDFDCMWWLCEWWLLSLPDDFFFSFLSCEGCRGSDLIATEKNKPTRKEENYTKRRCKYFKRTYLRSEGISCYKWKWSTNSNRQAKQDVIKYLSFFGSFKISFSSPLRGDRGGDASVRIDGVRVGDLFMSALFKSKNK